MQDLKKKKRKVNNLTDPVVCNTNTDEDYIENYEPYELSRSCGSKPKISYESGCHTNHKNSGSNCSNGSNCNCGSSCNCESSCNSNCDCDCGCHTKPKCEPCDIIAEECISNPCGADCCNPITTNNYCISNSVPYAIEANRIYDTMEFQTFTDAIASNGEPLTFDYEVISVNGNIPKSGMVNITIDEVCLNYCEILINPGCTTLEDYELQPLQPQNGVPCETDFLYSVCGEKDRKCCKEGKGKNVAYKEKGLSIIVKDLVLELKGRCGCTEITALAYPSVRIPGGQKRRCLDVEFIFNTLSAPLCLPADGKSITLRQDFRTSLTVDCIGKALLRYIDGDGCGCGCYYDLCIPNDIDLILCVQSVVSIMINEQIVVLGSPNPIKPRIVDTFSKVCDFSGCGDD